MKMLCQVCGEAVGDVNIGGEMDGRPPLRYPFNGSMVGSPDRAHGVPAPFDAGLDFEFVRCPYGRTHRPFVKDDLILTDKGMVRLPKDGSPAFIDPTAKAEVDRDSISDRTIMVSDEDAEKQAREILQGGPRVVESDEVPEGKILVMDKKNLKLLCPLCYKEFDSQKKLQGHIGGAHRAKKRGK